MILTIFITLNPASDCRLILVNAFILDIAVHSVGSQVDSVLTRVFVAFLKRQVCPLVQIKCLTWILLTNNNNLVTKCTGGVVTRNNTIWQVTIGGNNFNPICSLTIKTDFIPKRPAFDKDDEHASQYNQYWNEQEYHGSYGNGCKDRDRSVCQIRYDLRIRPTWIFNKQFHWIFIFVTVWISQHSISNSPINRPFVMLTHFK